MTRSVNIAEDFRGCSGDSRTRLAFSLIEVMIAVTLMSIIVLGLMAMFAETQRAFRTGITQVDVMESGRAGTEMLAREVEVAAPTKVFMGPNMTAGWNNYWLVQQLPGLSPASATQYRTNIQQFIGFSTRKGQEWTIIGYSTERPASSFIATLYRYETKVSELDLEAAINAGINPFDNVASRSKVIDGVLNMQVRAYDISGRLISPFNYPVNATTNEVVVLDNIPGQLSYGYNFRSNALPAYVEIELGILEAKTADRARNMDLETQTNYLARQAGKVQVFRQRIPIRNVDPSVYQ